MSSHGKANSSKLRSIIVGAGMSGILAAIKLKERGDTEIIVLEKAFELGGTWRDNRYPGLTCDTPAHTYSYSFAPSAEWDSYYATGAQIHAYFKKVATDFGVMPHIQFGAEVTACDFDDECGTWRVTVNGGETLECDIVIAASGVLHHPKVPDIPGLKSFAGEAFHSARWDDEARLDGTNVGVIGCGSTGIQIITALCERSSRLVHFQRSPQWVMPVPQFEYSEAEKAAFRNDPSLIAAIRNDPTYWENVFRFTDGVTDFNSPQIAAIEEVCLRNLEESVRDPELREKLRPDYRAACKRLIYSWQYYDCVQKPAVHVETGRIERIEPDGVCMQDGSFHPLDVLVLATGFKADHFIRPATVTGRDGRLLDDFWAVRPSAFFGVSLPGFPNFFLLNGPTSPVGNFPLIDIAERQWGYIDQLIEPLRQGVARRVEPHVKAFDAYEQRRIAAAKKTIFGSGCTSWYLDSEGIPATWPWGYQDFAHAMAAPVAQDFAYSS